MLLNSITLKFPLVHGHITENIININDIDVNKKNALEFLENDYRLDTSNVYVLGRNSTDLELMEKYNGYVLKDSDEDLKKLSKGVVNNLKELIDIINQEDERDIIDTIYE